MWEIGAIRLAGAGTLALLAGIVLWRFGRGRVTTSQWRNRGIPILLGILILERIGVGILLDRLPLGSPWEFVDLLALTLVALLVVVDLWLNRFRTIAPFVLAAAALLKLLAMGLWGWSPVAGVNWNLGPVVVAHVLLHAVAFAAIIFGAVVGIQYLLLHNSLKRKRFGFLYARLPALGDLSRLLLQGSVTAAMALVASSSAGLALYLDTGHGNPWDVKFCAGFTLLSLVILSLLIRWRIRRGVYVHAVMQVLVLVAALVTLFLVKHHIVLSGSP